MKYCMRCGVQLDESKNRVCPLCNTIILKDEEIEHLFQGEQKLEVQEKKSKKIKKEKVEMNKYGLTSFILFTSSISAIFILLLIDFLIGFTIDWSLIPIISILLFIILVNLPFMKVIKKIYWLITVDSIALCIYFILLNYLISSQITWSYYVYLSIILAWIYLSSIFLNKIKGFILKLTMDFLATSIYVLLITLGYNNDSGFAKLALPINGVVFIITVISYLFIKTYIYNWRVIMSTLSFNLSILCIGIDLLINRYIHKIFSLSWSYIVLAVLIPFTLFMMYLNNRYKVHIFLKKKFHI